MADYQDLYDASLSDPETFWLNAASDIDWIKKPTRALDDSNPPFYRWFPDARLNVCYNALDRHVIRGRADQTALIYDSPVTDTVQKFTYAELLDVVARAAGALRALGVEKGDRVVIYLPMIPEAAIAMLACARIGAVHSVVFGGFAPAELASRIEDAQPKVLITASCGVERTRTIAYKPMVDKAIELSPHKPDRVLVVQRPQLTAELGENDIDWATITKPGAVEPAECVAMAATDPLYVLYTSGTTGKPKGIVRDGGGYAVALQWSMTNLFGMHAGDVWLSASDVGWVVGHSYIVYGPLIAGVTTVIYEGKPVGTPDPSAFWRIVASYGVHGLFTAPTAFRAIKKEDPQAAMMKGHDLSTLRYLFLAGERLDPDTWQWATDALGIPVIDNWWQTETGWPIAMNPVGIEQLPIKPGSATVPVPGYDVQILDDLGSPCVPGVEGAVSIKLPLPPGTLPTVWGDDQRYVDAYLSAYDGYYLSGDGGYIDGDGYLFVLGRTDDVLNIAGHRLSTGVIEAALAGHPAVAECAVIGVRDQLKGQVPRALVVLKGGIDPTGDDADALRTEIGQRVRDEVGGIATLSGVDLVPALPKTRSGKILRRTMRQLADGDEAPVPSTIEDPAVLDALKPVLTHSDSE